MADSTVAYSVPAETQRIFSEQILSNPLVPPIDSETKALAKLVHFVGAAAPSIPINWRFAESISALKGYEATLINGLVTKKYGVAPSEVTIDVSHASLFVMSPLMAQVIDEVDGKPKSLSLMGTGIEKWFPNTDKHRLSGSLHRTLATNIYRTSDGRFYHVHGSMNPDPTLEALGLGPDGEEGDDHSSVVARIQEAVGKHEAAELDKLMNEKYKQAGTICYTTEEYLNSDFGKETSKVGLYEISKHPDSAQPASWWPENASMPSSPQRPLAGLKIVDLTRVIAGPSISRGLAEMGASVMKVASPHITDIHLLHQDLNWGKWSTHLHLKDEEDRKKLEALIMEADVVVDGYRPGVMEKHGFGRERIFELVKGRDRGIIHVRENCYGWKAPEWITRRSGWQQISDACCGVSMEYGRAMGNDEPVTPVFPNSDYCTGVIGGTAVLHALMQRASLGGSYALDISLNYYSQWLVQSVGTYPDAVWTELWERHESPVFRHYHNMTHTLFAVLKLLTAHDNDVMFRPEFFEVRPAKAVGATFVGVKPILNFVGPNAPVLRYNVGTRGNGVDDPVWPEDLGVEIVKSK